MLNVLRRNPQFRTLWIAQVVSGAGDWLNRVALLTLIGTLGGEEAVLGVGVLYGVELALRLLPAAFFGPLAGPVADRVSRKFLLIASDLMRVFIVLGFLFVRDPGDLPLLYVLLIAQMSLSIFFNSARSASLPNTVLPTDLHAALALSAATWSMMLAVGALAGGVLVEIVGVEGVFAADAATYLLSALVLSRLKLPAMPVHPEAFRWRDILLLTDLRRAWRHARDLGVIPIILAKSFWGPGGGFLVLLSIVARERFPTPGADVAVAGFATGVLYSARGVGTGLGPILARHWFGSSLSSLRKQIAVSFFLAAGGYAAFAVAGSLGLAFAMVLVAHCGGSTLWVASTTFWQRRVDDAFRGRTFALEFLGMTLSFTAGGLVAGFIYDATESIETTTWSVCGLVVVNGALWTLFARRVPIEEPAGEVDPG